VAFANFQRFFSQNRHSALARRWARSKKENSTKGSQHDGGRGGKSQLARFSRIGTLAGRKYARSAGTMNRVHEGERDDRETMMHE